MPNFIYGKAKESLFKGEINLLSNFIKVLFIDSQNYTPAQNIDQFVSDVPESAIKKRSNPLQNVTNNLGVIDAQDLVEIDYSGSPFDALILYLDHADDSSARLLAYIDSSVGLPFSGSSSVIPVTIVWDNGPTKIIAI